MCPMFLCGKKNIEKILLCAIYFYVVKKNIEKIIYREKGEKIILCGYLRESEQKHF